MRNPSNYVPTPEQQAAHEQMRKEMEHHALRRARDRREYCTGYEPGDVEFLIDWLEMGLEQSNPEFYLDMVRGFQPLVPEDRAWFVRNAERLADFNERFISTYLDRVHGGDLELLRSASLLFFRLTNHAPRFTPEPDYYRAWVYQVAAGLIPGNEDATRAGSDMRITAIQSELTSAELQQGREEGEILFARCCGGGTP